MYEPLAKKHIRITLTSERWHLMSLHTPNLLLKLDFRVFKVSCEQEATHPQLFFTKNYIVPFTLTCMLTFASKSAAEADGSVISTIINSNVRGTEIWT